VILSKFLQVDQWSSSPRATCTVTALVDCELNEFKFMLKCETTVGLGINPPENHLQFRCGDTIRLFTSPYTSQSWFVGELNGQTGGRSIRLGNYKSFSSIYISSSRPFEPYVDLLN
jgi:hypothetical protein